MSKAKSKTRNLRTFERVYEVVKKIPSGKVATYGQISRILKIKDSKLKITPRIVGFALHANNNPSVPCHRVVNRNGRLAPNFAFGGAREQRIRLETENVKFKDETHVDLEKCLWEENS